MINGFMNNKIYKVRIPEVKSPLRMVAEIVYEQAFGIFENLASQAK
jgi:hypothetical protein